MKFLVVAPYPPTPPLGGGRRRIFELVRALSRSNEVDLACTVFDHTEARALSEMDLPGVNLIGVPQQQRSGRARTGIALLDIMWNEALREAVVALTTANSYDWVVAEHSYAAQFIRDVRQRTILTAHNIEYRLLDQLITLGLEAEDARQLAGRAGALFSGGHVELARLRGFEEDAWNSVDVCAVVSPQERELIAQVTGLDRTVLVPNCPGVSPQARRSKKSNLPDVCFVGSLDYVPNVDAVLFLVREVLPRVRLNFPDVRLTIAGRSPQEALSRICRDAGATVIEDPVSLDEILGPGSILACPLRIGAGTRIKILDALATSTPVVASSLAVEGLDLDHTAEEVVLLGDTPAKFCANIERLLRSKALGESMAARGLSLLKQRGLEWPVTFARFVDWLQQRSESK